MGTVCTTRVSVGPGPRLFVWIFRNSIRFYGEELLTPRPTPKMGDHPLSAIRDFLLNIFSATIHTVGRSFIRNLRTRLARVERKHEGKRPLEGPRHRWEFLTFVIPMCSWIYTKCRFFLVKHVQFIAKNTFKATCFGSTEPSAGLFVRTNACPITSTFGTTSVAMMVYVCSTVYALNIP